MKDYKVVSNPKVSIGIVGGSGFVAGELIRLLLHHPKVKIDFIFSHSHAGQKVNHFHQDLFEYAELVFTDKVNLEVDLVFLSLGHGNSIRFLSKNNFSAKTKLIDLSNDFRLKKNALFQNRKFVYGLVELNKEQIASAQNIANPGCFATAIQLAILPFIKYSTVLKELHIQAITGSTGAGQTLSTSTSHAWRNNNISVYKAFTHQHLDEIQENISIGSEHSIPELNFLPYRGDFTRGIFASVYANTKFSAHELITFYKDYYNEAKFTWITDEELNLKQVINTNHCLIQVQKIGEKVLINSAIDNLLKGAAGQAVQNMNLMLGFEETDGLMLKAANF